MLNTPEDYQHLELQPDTLALIARAERYLNTHTQDFAATHTTPEFFHIILAHSIAALKNGNYGVAATLVEEEDGLQMIFVGTDSFIQDGNPFGFPEVSAIKARNVFREALQQKDAEKILELIMQGAIHQFNSDPSIDPFQRVIRPSLGRRSRSTLFTTFDSVHLPDMETESGVPMSHIVMETAEAYIPGELQDLLLDLFSKTRKEVDLRIINAYVQPDTSALAQPIIYGLVIDSITSDEL
jgi:hypothetical protein